MDPRSFTIAQNITTMDALTLSRAYTPLVGLSTAITPMILKKI